MTVQALPVAAGPTVPSAPGDPAPSEVAANLAVLSSLDVWHAVSRNPPVRSCAEAASRRNRLGSVGIPLRDELKSTVARLDGPGPARYVALHTRGHQRLAPEKVATVLQASVHRIDEDELRRRFGLSYGTVTPFALSRHGVTQIFDAGVLDRHFAPYTMMTNLGHLEYAVEFQPGQFVAACPGSRVEDIAEGKRRARSRGLTIGILTGNSPESGMLLWEKLNHRIRASPRITFRGDISFPRVLVESVPELGLSMELSERTDEVREAVTGAVHRLCANGATVVAVACNTTHYFAAEIRRICAEYRVTFVSMVDETTRFLRAEGIHRFDLLAIPAVAGSARWSEFRTLAAEFEAHVPARRHLDALTSLAFSVKREVVTSATLNKLRDLIGQAATTDTVVLALTELSILFAAQRQRQKSARRFVDTLDLLADRLAALYEDDRLAYGMN
ncbi:aspartate/glutamate racemase family protein [Actinoplanes sp. NPDC051859]|uniref:aspartate/glutamate racemase family protein n=1 Tax=Actinoplanes sp. NPDC051859 TaxID=3363909 RepID=UPI0037BCCEB9